MFAASTWLIAIVPTIAAPAQGAAIQDPAPAAEQEGALAPYDALKAEFDAAMKAWNESYEAAATDEARRALFNDYPTNAFASRFRTLAEEHPGTPVALKAWRFVIDNGNDEKAKDAALDAFEKDFLDAEDLGDVCLRLYTLSARAKSFFERVLKDSPHADARGKACYSLGKLENRRAALAADLKTMSAEKRESSAGYYGAETLAQLADADPAALRRTAEKLLERVVAEFGDIKMRRSTLGQTAESDLFEIRNLQIGMLAPDIAGEDVDGVAFKLSELQGKVVVIDFWGDW
jgi:hypothetical protein